MFKWDTTIKRVGSEKNNHIVIVSLYKDRRLEIFLKKKPHPVAIRINFYLINTLTITPPDRQAYCCKTFFKFIFLDVF